MDTRIMNLINGERDEEVELLNDTDNRVCAIDYFSALSTSLDEFEEKLGLYKKDKKLDNILKEYSGKEECQDLIKKIQEME